MLTLPCWCRWRICCRLSRQVVVLAYQYGAGICELLTPTNAALHGDPRRGAGAFRGLAAVYDSALSRPWWRSGCRRCCSAIGERAALNRCTGNAAQRAAAPTVDSVSSPSIMRSLSFSARACSSVLSSVAPRKSPRRRIPAKPIYESDGVTDQPFLLEVLDARRTVSNTLLVRTGPDEPGHRADAAAPRFLRQHQPDRRRPIPPLYAVDPNGRRKYAVLRDSQRPARSVRSIAPAKSSRANGGSSTPNCSRRRTPPVRSTSFSEGDPILERAHRPAAGGRADARRTPPSAISGRVPVPAAPVPVAPRTAIDQPTSNNLPNVYTNQTQSSPGRRARASARSRAPTPPCRSR